MPIPLSYNLRNLMAREPTASCALITRHPEQADAYFEGLRRAEVPALRRIRRDEFNFQPGIDVTDVTQVKGLEFDYVVMADVNDASYPDAPWARHLLHIGGVLRGGMDHHFAVLAGDGQRHLSLEVEVLLAADRQRSRHAARRGCEALLDIAAGEF